MVTKMSFLVKRFLPQPLPSLHPLVNVFVVCQINWIVIHTQNKQCASDVMNKIVFLKLTEFISINYKFTSSQVKSSSRATNIVS